MANISRGTKSASGTTQFQTGLGTILATEVDTDFDTVVTAINGNLDNTNVIASAGIELSKIDGYGDTTTEARTQTSPGVGDSESLASTAQAEIERLRYAISQTKNGIVAVHNNGTTVPTIYYGDTPARGNNLCRNGSFETKSSAVSTDAPDGWTQIDTPASITIADLGAGGVSNGTGRACRVVCNASDDEGMYQVLAGLKASTKYMIQARVYVTTGSCHLITLGADAASNFRDVDITVTGASWQSKAAVVQTDATPTSITVYFRGSTDATADDFVVDDVRFYECNNEPTTTPGYLAIYQSSTDATGNLAIGVGPFPVNDQLLRSVSVPGPGYTIKVTARLCFTGGAATGVCAGILQERPASTGIDTNRDVATEFSTSTKMDSISLGYMRVDPVPGETYRYGTYLDAEAAAGTPNGTYPSGTPAMSWMMIELIPPS